MRKPTVLMVEDEPSVLMGYGRYFGKAGFETFEAQSLSEARERVLERRFDAIMLDLNLPDGNGIDWLQDLRTSNPDVAIVVITGAGDIPMAVDAIRRGADNFLTKPVNLKDLEVFLRKSIELADLRRKDTALSRTTANTDAFEGQGVKLAAIKQLAELAAPKDMPILISGETGTGKGVLAKWIHKRSPQVASPFVEVNCSSLRGEILASELFGHAKGAFTSAVQDRQGLVDVADGGTLFLDEIGDMDIGVQAQFLKVIEEKSYRRLGETKVRHSEFRLLCATNRNLAEDAKQGRFRSDLFYRINVLPIEMPPLRERLEDMNLLIDHFLVMLGAPGIQLPDEITGMFKSYPWPGNIRELRNVLERGLLLAGANQQLDVSQFASMLGYQPSGRLNLHHAMAAAPDSVAIDQNTLPPQDASLEYMENNYILDAIKNSDGDMQQAAKKLCISRSTLYRRLKKIKETKG